MDELDVHGGDYSDEDVVQNMKTRASRKKVTIWLKILLAYSIDYFSHAFLLNTNLLTVNGENHIQTKLAQLKLE